MSDFKNPVHQVDYQGYVVSVYVVWGQDTIFYGEIRSSQTGDVHSTPKLYNTVEETVTASKDLVNSILGESK